uniref:septum site-determining protein n=1 Tax=Ulva aragoensis TaxID=1872694 RepID=UPI0028E0A180|nr:septum site-determining protein [Ulva aragoensis]WFS79949.1 septum site-determining protein [Ulva aragoensis]
MYFYKNYFFFNKKKQVYTCKSTKDKIEKNFSCNNKQSITRVIVFTSGKGGVGKTSTTANMGISIARLGYKIALIDADIGLKNLDLLIGLENRILYTVMDVFEGNCRLDQALIRDKRWKNLSLLCISKNRQRYNITKKNMKTLIDSLINLNFSYIFIDCPAGIDIGFINAITAANEAIIITTPELPALRDADRVAGLLEANGIYDIKLLINRVRSDMIKKNDMLSVKDVQEALGIPLLGAIPEDEQIIISTNLGEPLVLKNKLTLAGIAFENATRRLIGKDINFINLEQPYKNIFQKLKDFFVTIYN